KARSAAVGCRACRGRAARCRLAGRSRHRAHDGTPPSSSASTTQSSARCRCDARRGLARPAARSKSLSCRANAVRSSWKVAGVGNLQTIALACCGRRTTQRRRLAPWSRSTRSYHWPFSVRPGPTADRPPMLIEIHGCNGHAMTVHLVFEIERSPDHGVQQHPVDTRGGVGRRRDVLQVGEELIHVPWVYAVSSEPLRQRLMVVLRV